MKYILAFFTVYTMVISQTIAKIDTNQVNLLLLKGDSLRKKADLKSALKYYNQAYSFVNQL